MEEKFDSVEIEKQSNNVEHEDGRVELRDLNEISASPLYNPDLAPVPIANRNWTTYNYAALWISMSACIPTYMLSSGLIASGMNWWQAILTVLVGNLIVLIPILLNSHPGTKYGIPFPVFARAAYGTFGSNLPALMRALVACGWFGIQCWLGGKALFILFWALNSDYAGCLGQELLMGHLKTEWLSFSIFWLLNVLVIFKGMTLLKKVEGVAAPFIFGMCTILVVWAVSAAHGLGALVNNESRFADIGSFLGIFFPSLTAIIGFWSTLSLNMPDFTRYGRSQREQIIGQAVALPLAMTTLSTMGVVVTSAAMVVFGHIPANQLWDPMSLIGKFDNHAVVAVAMFTIAFATLSMNTAANVVSPANDFSNALPRFVSFRTGALITAVLGVLMQPWGLVADPRGYIFKWLVGYSGGLGAIAGVLIIDYWYLKKKRLLLADLYLKDGAYRYTAGCNIAAIAATLIGCAAAWSGYVIVEFQSSVGYGWFIAVAVSAIAYMMFMPVPKKNQSS